MIQIKLFTKQTQTHRLQKQSYAYPRGNVGGGINEEVGIHEVQYVKQINTKNLLYSTKNSTQYSVITYMGKDKHSS